MNLIPKQIEADEEVIDYWLKKLRWTRYEFACLFCGINPKAYEIFDMRLLQHVEFTIDDIKIEEITDLALFIDDRIEFHLTLTNTPDKWKSLAIQLELQLPAWFERISDTDISNTSINSSISNEVPEQISKEGISTTEMAYAFSGLKWTEQQWKHQLGSGSQNWLKNARITKGLRGKQTGGVRIPSTWNPLEIASVLAQENYSILKITKSFKSSPKMLDWLDEWEEYRETHYPVD